MSSLYKQIADEISQEIVNGKYEETMRLPKEEDLISKYNVSRTTIRKSISILANKGYVYQIQGSGIFIREAALKNYLSLENLRGLTRDYPTKKVGAKLLDIKVIKCDEDLSHKMKCAKGTNVYFIKRIRFIDDEEFTIEYSYFRKDIIPYLNEEIAHKSIYTYITDDLGLNIGYADRLIYCEKLNEEDSLLLGLEKDDPALIIENTTLLNNGVIFEVSRAVHNYKNTKLIKLSNF